MMISRVFGVMRDSSASALKPKPSFSSRGRGTGVAPVKLDHRLVDREAGVRIDDLGAGLAEHEDGEEHGHLAAGNHHDLIGADIHAVAAMQIGGDRLAELRDAVGRRVSVMTVL